MISSLIHPLCNRKPRRTNGRIPSRTTRLRAPSPDGGVVRDAGYGGRTVAALKPGTYAGIRASGEAVVNLAPGIYYLTGSLVLTGRAQLVGGQVTLVLAPGSGIVLTGEATATLTPPAAGPFRGKVVCGGRRGAAPVLVTGGGDFLFAGAVEVPGSTISVSGRGVFQGIEARVVARTLTGADTALVDIKPAA